MFISPFWSYYSVDFGAIFGYKCATLSNLGIEEIGGGFFFCSFFCFFFGEKGSILLRRTLSK